MPKRRLPSCWSYEVLLPDAPKLHRSGGDLVAHCAVRIRRDAPRAQPRHAMMHKIAIMSLEDRRPLRHVSLSEGEGGDEE